MIEEWGPSATGHTFDPPANAWAFRLDRLELCARPCKQRLGLYRRERLAADAQEDLLVRLGRRRDTFVTTPYKHGMQQDPWENAVICALAAVAASDPLRRALLVDLGEFWLEVARHDTSQISAKVAIDIVMIEKLQGEILGIRTTIH